MVGHHLPQLGDLAVESGDEPDLAGHDRGVAAWLGEPVGA